MFKIFGIDNEMYEPFVLRGLSRHVESDGDGNRRRNRRKLLQLLRQDQDQREMVVSLVALKMEEEGVEPDPAQPEGRGGFLIKILDWMAAHKEFLEWIFGLFSGAAMAQLEDDEDDGEGPVAAAGLMDVVDAGFKVGTKEVYDFLKLCEKYSINLRKAVEVLYKGTWPEGDPAPPAAIQRALVKIAA
jgi:hypothetical protein